MRKFYFLSLLLAITTTLFIGCTKEGPEGPVGATGAQGPAGGPGTPGPGATYSAWFKTTEAGWEPGHAEFFAQYSFQKPAPLVTQVVMDQGVVLGYMKGDPIYANSATPNAIFQLPYSVGMNYYDDIPVTWTDVYDMVIPSPGKLVFLYKSDYPWTAADLGEISFRYIIITGTIAGRGNAAPTYGGYTVSELKALPYEKVATLFNIPAEGSNLEK